MLKNLNFPMDFEKAFLKAGWGSGVAECVVSLCTSLWLVDDEVTGRYYMVSLAP